LSDFNEAWIIWAHFRKTPNIKFHENLSSESRVILRGRTDMTRLTGAFRNFPSAPKKHANLLRWFTCPFLNHEFF